MRKFFFGLLIGIIVVPAGFYLYLCSGNAPVATSAPPMPLERFLVRTAMHATISHHERTIHLANVNNQTLVAGAHTYLDDCAVCHGLPDQPPTAVADGMYPRPPQFFRANARKIDDPPGEVYWKIKNGIRLTGMPGFRQTLDGAQLRDLTGFIEDATSLPPVVITALKSIPTKVKGPNSPRKGHVPVKQKRG